MAANLRKRRGVTRRSITRMTDRIADLEGTPDQPRNADRAKQLLAKLQTLDTDYRTVHFQIVDLIDEADEGGLDAEQERIDKLDDDVASLTVRLEALISPPVAPPAVVFDRRPLTRKLARVQTGISRIDEDTTTTDARPFDRTLLSQYCDELSDYKKDLAHLYEELAAEAIADDDELFATHLTLERQLSDTNRKVKSLFTVPPGVAPTSHATDSSGVNLPKLDTPTFDGNIIHWKQFWDQFVVAVHNKTNLSNAEKSVYLQHAIKGGSAKNVIEGLSHSGDNYEEAIECLKARYDRPRLIQRTHVQFIIDAPPLKEGSGRELRRLHDVIQQHVRALKTLGCDLPGQFITSMMELKLDTDTLFEWQKHTQTEVEVPHYQQLLDFIDARAQASETMCVTSKKPTQIPKKSPGRVAVHATATDIKCPVCATEKHPLYMCGKFKSMSPEEKMQVVKTKHLCANCLSSGHFKSHCRSNHKCKVCQKPHHTLLHHNIQDSESTTANAQSYTVARVKTDMLLMTSRVLITSPDGSTVEARALLDNASSASFVTERLVRSLSLPRTNQHIRVSGIGGISHKPPLQSVTQFQLSSLRPGGRKIHVTAVVVPKVTCDLPMAPVTFQMSWTHISNLPLADPEFTQPGRVDILLGADVFVDVLRHGRRSGLPGSPTAFETDLGWVICGTTGFCSPSAQANVHITTFHTSVTSSDDVLRKFWELEESPLHQSYLTAEECTVVRHFESNHTRSAEGRFIVPLPRNLDAGTIGESRSQAVRRFLSLERSLIHKGCFQDFDAVMQEYLDLDHAEEVPTSDLEKPLENTFYLPMHAVYKTSSMHHH